MLEDANAGNSIARIASRQLLTFLPLKKISRSCQLIFVANLLVSLNSDLAVVLYRMWAWCVVDDQFFF